MFEGGTLLTSIEMSGDPRFARRIKRLAATATVALGIIFYLGSTADTVSVAVRGGLLLGWLLMPTTLVASLHWPTLRYALTIPSLSVGFALLALVAGWSSEDRLELAGWTSIAAGTWLGAAMGMWFWYRWFPVPSALDDPFSPARWAVIVIHVALVAGGALAVAVAQGLTG